MSDVFLFVGFVCWVVGLVVLAVLPSSFQASLFAINSLALVVNFWAWSAQ